MDYDTKSDIIAVRLALSSKLYRTNLEKVFILNRAHLYELVVCTTTFITRLQCQQFVDTLLLETA